MPKDFQVPTIEETSTGYEESHPAYGVISVSRTQSSPGAELFGSDLKHSNFITIRVRTAIFERSLDRDWVYPRKELIEISMSESQWARFVSGAGNSFSTEVTLNSYRDGEYMSVPGIKKEEISRKDRFDAEFHGKILKALDEINSQLELLRELSDQKSISKAKLRQIVNDLSIRLQNLPGNMDFAVESFKEITERTVDEAKSEISAYVVAAAQKMGLPLAEIPQLPSDTSTN